MSSHPAIQYGSTYAAIFILANDNQWMSHVYFLCQSNRN
ncbi:hypothetical protein P38_0232 [Pseudomonas aeruginosa MH38]|nr:hypothetical protein P38_0232 [Pseudomonas aeruginosa MH38]